MYSRAFCPFSAILTGFLPSDVQFITEEILKQFRRFLNNRKMNKRKNDVLSRVEDVAKQRLSNPHTQGAAQMMLEYIKANRQRRQYLVSSQI